MFEALGRASARALCVVTEDCDAAKVKNERTVYAAKSKEKSTCLVQKLLKRGLFIIDSDSVGEQDVLREAHQGT